MKKMQVIGMAAAIALAALGGRPAFAANIVTLKNGKTIEAKTIQWRESQQEYRVETAQGILPIPRNQVEKLEIDKPADFDKAVALVNAGSIDTAVPILKTIVDTYAMRVWDNAAREVLAKAYLFKKEPKKAVGMLEDMFKTVPAEETPIALRRVYWQALSESEMWSSLKKELDVVVASGTREAAAVAQVMRGDMARAQGQKEEALLDYLRTVLLFEEAREAHPEALFKAAELLDELRDPRATELRTRLTKEYPESAYARKLSGKI